MDSIGTHAPFTVRAIRAPPTAIRRREKRDLPRDNAALDDRCADVAERACILDPRDRNGTSRARDIDRQCLGEQVPGAIDVRCAPHDPTGDDRGMRLETNVPKRGYALSPARRYVDAFDAIPARAKRNDRPVGLRPRSEDLSRDDRLDRAPRLQRVHALDVARERVVIVQRRNHVHRFDRRWHRPERRVRLHLARRRKSASPDCEVRARRVVSLQELDAPRVAIAPTDEARRSGRAIETRKIPIRRVEKNTVRQIERLRNDGRRRHPFVGW